MIELWKGWGRQMGVAGAKFAKISIKAISREIAILKTNGRLILVKRAAALYQAVMQGHCHYFRGGGVAVCAISEGGAPITAAHFKICYPRCLSNGTVFSV